MKLYRTNYSSVFMMYFPFMGLITFLILTAYSQYAHIYLVHWLFLLLAILALLAPSRSQHWGERTLTWPTWLLLVTSFVGLLQGFFYVTSFYLPRYVPINQPMQITLETSNDLLISGGLFPWCLVALFAITLQKIAEGDRLPGLISSCLQQLFRTTEHEDVGKFMNIYVRHATLFALVLPLMVMGFAVIYLVYSLLVFPMPLGINILSLLLTTIIFWFITFSRWLRGLNWLLDHHVPKLLSVLCLFFSLVFFLAAATYLITQLLHANQIPVINYSIFNAAAWPELWQCFITFFEFCWIPFASAVIATVSRGYRVWQIILVTLLVPMGITCYHFSSWQFSIAIDHYGYAGITTIVCLLVLWVSFRPRYLTHLMHATLPFPHEIKQRNTTMYCRTTVTTAAMLFCVYWVMGIFGINIMYAIVTTPIIVLIPLSVVTHFNFGVKS